MKYNVLTIPPFDKQLKRLASKYPSLKIEISKLIDVLEVNPDQGSPIGNNCYKLRLAIASKGKGKSGGARIITNVKVMKSKVYLLSIYDKSELDSISESDIKDLLKLLPD